MIRRSPRFNVITNSLVGLAAIGLGLKFAARFLPERQPNRLALEYGSYTKSAARQKVDWYPLSEEAFDLAKRTNKLILIDISNLYSRTANIFRHEHLEDDELARLLGNFFVCIKCDTEEAPWLQQTLELNSTTFQQVDGCLLVALNSTGGILGESPIRNLRTSGKELGLYEWLEELARKRVTDKESLTALVAKGVDAREKASLAVIIPSAVSADTGFELSTRLREAINDGSYYQSPFYVSASLPETLLIASQTFSEYAEQPANVLLQLRESSCFDNVNGGFFLQSNAPFWRRPGYGKIAGMNAMLAALYARASNLLASPLFAATARQTFDWLETVEQPGTGLFNKGVGNDEILLDGSPFYDWSSDNIPLRPSAVLEVEDVASGRGPLRLKHEPNAEAAVSQERAAKILNAAAALRARTVDRIPPRTDATTYADENAQVVASLFSAAVQLNDAKLLNKASAAYSSCLAVFVQSFGDVLHAPEGLARTTGYAGDYVWMARAAIENYCATGDPNALATAIRITDRFVELFGHPSGAYLSYLSSQMSFAPFAVPCMQIVDTRSPSINAIAARNFADLSTITGNPIYKQKALNLLTAFGGAIAQVKIPPPGYVTAILRIYQNALIVKGPSAIRLSAKLSRSYPFIPVAPIPLERQGMKASGIYIEKLGKIRGPYTENNLSAALKQ